MVKKVLVLFILVSSLLLLAGCDFSDLSDSISVEKGRFEAEYKGPIELSFRGEAVFNTLHGLAGEPYFYLILRDVKKPGKIYRIVTFLKPLDDQLKTGVYELTNFIIRQSAGTDNVNGSYQDSNYKGQFRPAGGKLSIYSSNKEELLGVFQLKVIKQTPDGKGGYSQSKALICGEFFAEKGDVGIILN